MRASQFALVMIAAATATSTHAQQYPTKPIRIIVGAAPGGGTDFVARLVGNSWALAKVLRSESAQYGRIIKTVGIKGE